jgi:sugar phosphate isomerase/epimerase
MPFSAIATVPMGAEIIAAAGHPGAGLLVDAWHVFRAGTTLAELSATLRSEMIFAVELDDAAPDVVGNLFEDTVDNRLLCGEGCFDLTGWWRCFATWASTAHGVWRSFPRPTGRCRWPTPSSWPPSRH